MKRIFVLIALCFGMTLGCKSDPYPVVHLDHFSSLPVWDPEYRTTFVEEYDSGKPDENELEGVQSPIPMECRVRNYTGTQCVFSSLECLARWAELKALLEPEPLTSRAGCRSYSSPTDAASKLTNFGVKFENEYKDRGKAIQLLKKAMAEGRGALMDVPGHAIVICHYDEEAGVVKIIDNSDRSLKVQTWTMAKFKDKWGGWIMVVYAEKDLFPDKAKASLANQIPIIDKNNPQGEYPKDYIPTPKK
jgi:hypothetical protein